MTFPTIPTEAANRILGSLETAAASTHDFPSLTGLTKNSGDLLVAIIFFYNGSTVNAQFSGWGGGFTEFADFANSSVLSIGAAYKFSSGSETGSFTVTSSGAQHSAMVLMSIPGAHATAPPEAGGYTTVVGCDPGSLSPSWGAEDTLFIAAAGCGETSTTGSFTGIAAAPTSYTDYFDTGISADVVGGIEGAVAFRQLNTASEDPGAFSNDTSNTRGGAITIAVRPAAGVPPPNVGAATGGVEAAGSATGSRTSGGSSAGTVDAAGSATGQRISAGSAPGFDVIDAGNTATPPVDVIDAGDTATPPTDIIDSGDTAVGVVITGTATGAMPSAIPSGDATGTVVTAGSATGSAPTGGASTGSVTAAGSATGSRPAGGAAAGTVDTTGSSTGSRPSAGSVTGEVATAGSATGTAPGVGINEGAATGAVALAGSATGSAPTRGEAIGQISTAGTATGSRASTGSSISTVTAAGSATGSAPTVGAKEGATTGAVTIAGSATGSAPSGGQATGQVVTAGSAVGGRVSLGSATGIVTISGTATGFIGAIPVPSGHKVIIGSSGHAVTAHAGSHVVEVG